MQDYWPINENWATTIIGQKLASATTSTEL
jgi:hypothetical protein